MFKSVNQILQDGTLVNEILQNTSYYAFESRNGKIYAFEDVIEAFEEDQDNFLDFLEENYKAIDEKPLVRDLEVISIN